MLVIELSIKSKPLVLSRNFFQRTYLLQLALIGLLLGMAAWGMHSFFEQALETRIQGELGESLESLQGVLLQSGHPPRAWCGLVGPGRELVVLDSGGEVACRSRAQGVAGSRSLVVTSRLEAWGGEWSLRQGVSRQSLEAQLAVIDGMILWTWLVLLVALGAISLNCKRRLIRPLRDVLQQLQHVGVKGEGDFSLEESFNRVQVGLQEYLQNLYLENEKNSILIHSISDGILAVDLESKVILMNNNFRYNFLPHYVNSMEDIKDRPVWDILRNIQVRKSFCEVLEDRAEKVFADIELLKRNKQKGFYHLSISQIKGVGKKTEGAIGIFRDSSEQRLTEQMRTDFVTNVSHEVRTPITAIVGYAQVMISQADALSPVLRDYLQRIQQNCERLTALFNDILHLSVIDSKVKMDLVNIEIDDLVSQVMANVGQSYPDKKIRFERQIEVKAFYGDFLLIEQLLTNLVDNACKYNQPNGRVKVVWQGDGKQSVLIVEDDGIGIPEKHWPRLFERFYRVDPSRSREMGGTGLGLAIVKHIVLKHNGKIEVARGQWGGGLFKATLPHLTPNG